MYVATILIGYDTAARGLTDIYARSRGRQRERADISVKPQACPCYNDYVTFQ